MTGLVALGVGGAVALAIFTIVFVLLSPQVQKADDAVQGLLAPERGVRGVTDREIVLGMASAFTGANRELGRSMRAGVEAALAAVNASGGVHGRKLRLVAVDDGYEPSRTGPAMRQLVEQDRVFAVVGNVGTPTAAVSIPYCLERKVVFFGAFTGGDLLRRQPPDRYVFNFRPSYSEETSAAIRWLVRVRRIAPERIAVFSQDDEFGESGFRGVAAQLRALGVDPARAVRVRYRRNTADVADAIATLRTRAHEVDAVVMVATYRAAAAFIRKARDAGLGVPATSVSAVDASALAEDLVASGARYAKDVMVTQVVPLPTSRSAAVRRFQEALEAGERPGFVTLEGWIVGNLLAEALRRAGQDLDTEKLVAALEGIRDLDLGVGARLGFSPTEHQASHKVWGTALQPDGSYRQIDLE
ncbi:MAG TPA: ABC transporter substrate-binding protein [Anaeromyxobacter sp.]|nr:ABC transporter substrate-binding protein [Anaeromyxobacter sp.]